MRKKEPREQIVIVQRRMRFVPHKCPICGTDFMGQTNKKFCSRTCVRKATYEKHGDEYRKARMERYRGQKS